jgi:hypothetical protein
MRPPVFLFAFADDKDEHLSELNREKLEIAEILTDTNYSRKSTIGGFENYSFT